MILKFCTVLFYVVYVQGNDTFVNNTISTILEETTTLLTTCSDDSCTTDTTGKQNSPTPKPTETSPSNASANGLNYIPQKDIYKGFIGRSNKDICICDLKINFCDINCCCDKDCTLNDKLVFGHCEKDFRQYDNRFCSYKKHVYINKTLHEYQVNQKGLFCVVAHNAPPSYLIQRKDPLKTFKEAEFEKIGKFSWSRAETIVEKEPISFRNYTYGKPLLIIDNNTIKTLQYLRKFVVNNCLVPEDVKFLVDETSSCIYPEISQDNIYLNPQNYFTNISIITNPGLVNLSSKENIFKNCSKICLSPVIKFCDKHLEKCTQIAKNFTHLKLICHLSISTNKLFCNNLVKHIKYNFYHNGTEGLVKIEILINLANISYSLSESYEFSQSFQTRFIWWNHTLNFSSYHSGNPGYIIEKPVLIANAVSVNISNNSTKNHTVYTKQLRLFRNPFDFTSNFMVFPYVNNDGNCVINKHEYTPAEFGVNMHLKCTIDEFIQNNNISAKNKCVEMQNVIFKYWTLNLANNTLSNRLIGRFGNANVSNIDEWVRVMYQKDVKDILNQTWGQFDKITKSLTCGNITTSLLWDIYHSRIDFDEVVNQEMILGVTAQFSGFSNFTLYLNPKGEFRFAVKVAVQVQYFDITAEKIRRIVDPPSLNIRLPHDFFYPFVKLNNVGSNRCLYAHLIVYSFIFVYLNK